MGDLVLLGVFVFFVGELDLVFGGLGGAGVVL